LYSSCGAPFGVAVGRRVLGEWMLISDGQITRRRTCCGVGRLADGVTLLVKFMHGRRGALTVDTVNSYFGSTPPPPVVP